MTSAIENKKMIRNRYNNKVVLQKILEMLGANKEISENDLVLNILFTIFCGTIELFDFSEVNYFEGYENIDEILDCLIKILIRENYKALEDKIIVEDNLNFFIMRIGRMISTFEFDYYVGDLELYLGRPLDINNDMVEKFMAYELYYDKKKKTVSYRNQEIIPLHYEEKNLRYKNFIKVNTVVEEYDENKKLVNRVAQYYKGNVKHRKLYFFSYFNYYRNLNIFVQDERIHVDYENLDQDTQEKIIAKSFDCELKYEKMYDDYIKGRTFSFHLLEQEQKKNDNNHKDSLNEADFLLFGDRNCVGVRYRFDWRIITFINRQLSMNQLEENRKICEKKKMKIIRNR